ncbi:hypothetical protein [Nocardia abscessus]|uniref:hypothetical protein n=1 Tax=Nocardia abscessus TaxID=120957 RepID=UPI00245783F8|nr:hypothetical protein [Nocardia abscessus]
MKYEDHVGLVTPQAVRDGIVRERRPFVQIPKWVLHADISANAYRVYGVLTDHADNLTRFGFPRKEVIAKAARMSISALDRALAELKRIGAVFTFERWRGTDPATGVDSWSVVRDEVHYQRDSNGYVVMWNPPHPVDNSADDLVDNPVPSGDGRTPHPMSGGSAHTAGGVYPHTAGGVDNYIYKELDPEELERVGHRPLPSATPPPVDIPMGARRASRLPDDWQPSPSSVEWARKFVGSGLDLGAELEKFTNYWQSKHGRDAIKRDWDKAWRYWLQRGYEQHTRNAHQRLTRTERFIVVGELGKDSPSADALRAHGIDPAPWFHADGTLRVPVGSAP